MLFRSRVLSDLTAAVLSLLTAGTLLTGGCAAKGGGTLSAGAALVLPHPEHGRDPEHWLNLMQRHHVTVWNSVPALMQMLIAFVQGQTDALLSDLRLTLLSGDWLPVNLPAKIRTLAPHAQIVSLGGATEASIWSIAWPVDRDTTELASIPYGFPLANQNWHVLDAALRDCPDWTTGELVNHRRGEEVADEIPEDIASYLRILRHAPEPGSTLGHRPSLLPDDWVGLCRTRSAEELKRILRVRNVDATLWGSRTEAHMFPETPLEVFRRLVETRGADLDRCHEQPTSAFHETIMVGATTQ